VVLRSPLFPHVLHALHRHPMWGPKLGGDSLSREIVGADQRAYCTWTNGPEYVVSIPLRTQAHHFDIGTRRRRLMAPYVARPIIDQKTYPDVKCKCVDFSYT
jgi:hypothetical protein